MTAAQTTVITVEALNGKDQKPLANQHLVIFAGPSAEGPRFHRIACDARTDDHGIAKVALDISGTNWIQVWTEGLTLCQEKPNLNSFRVADIVSTGLASPNTCGSLAVPLKPGTFIVTARAATLREKMGR